MPEKKEAVFCVLCERDEAIESFSIWQLREIKWSRGQQDIVHCVRGFLCADDDDDDDFDMLTVPPHICGIEKRGEEK